MVAAAAGQCGDSRPASRMSSLWWCVVVLAVTSVVQSADIYTVCVLPRTASYHSAEVICQKLLTTKIRCVIGADRLDCVRKMTDGKADFAVLEAEDLLIAADTRHTSDILITHRIHATEDKKWEFAVVALISDKTKVTQLSDLRGTRLCHPGNNPSASNYDWSDVFSLYFENRVAPLKCDNDVSVEENRIKALANFFGESCKPGVWAADPAVDAKLKVRYHSMCGLCDVPSVCSQRDKYWGRQGALYCLSDCQGNLAWSILKDAKLHFNSAKVSLCSDVSLLCPDGTTMPLNSTEPCVWVTRPVPVIAAKRTKAEEVQTLLKEMLVMADTPNDFIHLLEASPYMPPLQVKPSITPSDYLATAPGYLSANSMSVCGQDYRAVTVCVGALEDKIKCEWLASVSHVYGLQPSLRCTYGANCLVSVANGSADTTISFTDHLLAAQRDHNLKPLFVQMPTVLTKAKTVSAVVNAKSNIKTFADMKGKKACFGSVDGMGWTSFLMKMKKTQDFAGVCPHVKAMSKFFSDIRVAEPSKSIADYPNIQVSTLDPHPDQLPYDEDTISYNNEAVAFLCLAVGGGDVAFISTDTIPKHIEEMRETVVDLEGITADSFRAVCADDKNCELSWASYSQVLVHKGISASREEDIRSVFTGLNNLFVQVNTPSTRTYNMFSPTNSLFDTTLSSQLTVVGQRLEQMEAFLKRSKHLSQHRVNYETSLPSVQTCIPSSATRSLNSLLTVLLLAFTSLTYFN